MLAGIVILAKFALLFRHGHFPQQNETPYSSFHCCLACIAGRRLQPALALQRRLLSLGLLQKWSVLRAITVGMACYDLSLETLSMPSLQHYEPRRISLNGKCYTKCSSSCQALMHQSHDLTGQKIGRLQVLQRSQSIKGASTWLCQCDCGVVKSIRGQYLRNGDAISCGCYHKEAVRKHGRRGKKGDPRDPTYLSFISMKGRVMNPNNPAYHNYGGRGIQICKAWINGGFTQFLKDMGDRPQGKSLDRIDHNGDYTPENCRWATAIEQSQNRRGLHLLTCNGKIQAFSAWARELGISRGVLQRKLDKGMSLENLCHEYLANY